MSFRHHSEISEFGSTSCHNYLIGTNKKFECHPITTNQVLSLLNKLEKPKAVGLDNMSVDADLLKLQKLQNRAAHIVTYSMTLISVISLTPRMENTILSEAN